MESDLLNQGLLLMLAGIAVVFVFLSLLVAATTAMSRIVMRFQPVNTSPVKDEEIAAITAAITQHRGKRKTN